MVHIVSGLGNDNSVYGADSIAGNDRCRSALPQFPRPGHWGHGSSSISANLHILPVLPTHCISILYHSQDFQPEYICQPPYIPIVYTGPPIRWISSPSSSATLHILPVSVHLPYIYIIQCSSTQIVIRTSASSQSVSTATLQSPYTPYPHYQMQSAVCSASIRYFEISKHKSLSMSTAMFSWVLLRQLVWLVIWEIVIGQSRCQPASSTLALLCPSCCPEERNLCQYSGHPASVFINPRSGHCQPVQMHPL